MPAAAHSLRIPEPLESEIQRELARRGSTEWSAGVLALLDEAVRVSRAPGIVFVDSRTGRRAAVAHSGLEAWEIVATWIEGGRSWPKLVEAYPELSDIQLRSAINYYALYPAEIDARLTREAEWTPERVARELPFTQVSTTTPAVPPRPARRRK